MKRWIPATAGVAAIAAAALLWWWPRRSAGAAVDVPVAPPVAYQPLPHPVQIEVLNASGVANLARVATTRLRAGGLDVVYFGSASGLASPQAVTRVLKRGADTTGLGRVLEVLGVAAAVEDAPPENRMVAFSVLLGRDYHKGRGQP